jgi:anaerobic ribonucleoside-triphosphate reductase-activating protein
MDKIEVGGWLRESCDDGPGIRSVLFLQGCKMNCPGCHNQQLREKGGGTMLEIGELENFIMNKCHNKKVTISGGEPLEQWDSLKQLVKILKEKNFNICIYTGWDKEDIPDDVFLLADYLKYGSYKREMATNNIHYVGSKNQQMLKKDATGCWNEIDLILPT